MEFFQEEKPRTDGRGDAVVVSLERSPVPPSAGSTCTHMNNGNDRGYKADFEIYRIQTKKNHQYYPLIMARELCIIYQGCIFEESSQILANASIKLFSGAFSNGAIKS
ncbi:unnamed protein product [Dovyalis caffra]|uniref:Uncharacterized protein n=1 Tax=Dovyalis caffra TaxID=77055 RepID=A0AAV1S4W8_9ROSI|nr:unnamed protein product [Dovyalis caffra]